MAFWITDGLLRKYEEEEGVTEVVIPDGVTEIGYIAFGSCKTITSVIIPEGVTSIGAYAFQVCTNLTSITIPESVTSIGENAFARSLWLENYPDDFVIINGILHKYKGSAADVTIPEYAAKIGNNAFKGCESLVSVTIPDTVTEIGDSAFENCKTLVSVRFPEHITSIGSYAFSMTGLQSVVVPKSVTSIGLSAFAGCKKIAIYDTIDPDAKDCESHVDAINGRPNSNVGYIGIRLYASTCAANAEWFDHEIAVISAETEQVKYTVPMYADKAQRKAYCTLTSSWGRNGTFNFDAIDQLLPSLKNAEYKLIFVLNRLKWKYQLSEEQQKVHEAFLKRNIKKAVGIAIAHDDAEAMQMLLDTGFITAKHIDDMIASAIEHTQNGGSAEMQAMLMKYKSEVTGYKDAKNMFKL